VIVIDNADTRPTKFGAARGCTGALKGRPEPKLTDTSTMRSAPLPIRDP
jgi:hypothetical protein